MQQTEQIAEILDCLNRSQQAVNEASWFTAREAAGKQINACRQWLKDKRISHRMNGKGVWVLGR